MDNVFIHKYCTPEMKEEIIGLTKEICFEDELEMAGLDRFDLEMMDEDERNATLEDAGLDPFDWEEV